MGSLSLVLEKAPKLFPPPPRSSSGLEECVWKERTEFPRGIKTRAFFFFSLENFPNWGHLAWGGWGAHALATKFGASLLIPRSPRTGQKRPSAL